MKKKAIRSILLCFLASCSLISNSQKNTTYLTATEIQKKSEITTLPILTLVKVQSATMVAPTKRTTPPLIETEIPKYVPTIEKEALQFEAVVGDNIIIDASEIWNLNTSKIDFSWKQVFNADQYDGNEYLTSNPISIDNTDTPILSFIPNWPGRYRFEVVASDKFEISTEILDVVIYPNEQLFNIRGMAIDKHDGVWSENKARMLLEYLVDVGFNYVQLGMHDTMETPNSNSILVDQCGENIFLNLDQIIQMIDLAHEYDLGVMLSPHLACNIAGDWYEFYNISPEDPKIWFESYKDYAFYYAQLAENHDVEILNLGGGMQQFYKFSSDWEDLLSGVRNVYSGQIAFSWFNFPIWADNPEFPRIGDLDFLVQSFTWNGSGTSFTGKREGKSNPTIDQMIFYFDQEVTRYISTIQKNYDKQVIGTDIYPWPIDGMNINPVSLYWDLDEYKNIDFQEQVDYAEAAFRVMNSNNWDGFFFWALSIGSPQKTMREPEIRGLPIEDMLRIWFHVGKKI